MNAGVKIFSHFTVQLHFTFVIHSALCTNNRFFRYSISKYQSV